MVTSHLKILPRRRGIGSGSLMADSLPAARAGACCNSAGSPLPALLLLWLNYEDLIAIRVSVASFLTCVIPGGESSNSFDR